MIVLSLQEQLLVAEEKLRAMQEELAQTNRGLMALTMELEDRVENRTRQLTSTQAELSEANSELLQMTIELEDRVVSRTNELKTANEFLREARVAAMNLTEDAVKAREIAVEANRKLREEITERKRVEKEIVQLNIDLERKVQERTMNLESVNKELEAFSYSVSHDLRAPLRSIDGFSQALLEDYSGKIDDQGKDYLRRVRVSTQKMATLIDDMLTLSRVTRASMNTVTVNLSAITQSILKELSEQEPERKAEFVITPDLTDSADIALITSVLQNLLENAWKFTSKKLVAHIEFGLSEKNGTKAYVVRDNGAGFEMTYKDKLFIPFQRLHTTIEFPGTGVGLATVQRIIRRHHGMIWAEGEVGKGSAFYFTLNS